MTLEDRITQLVKEAIRVAGTGEALATRLGVHPTAVTHWKNGRTAPDAKHLIRLQDIVKKAACVVAAVLFSTQAPDAGADTTNSAPPPWRASCQPTATPEAATRLCIMLSRIKRLFRLLKSAIRVPAIRLALE